MNTIPKLSLVRCFVGVVSLSLFLCYRLEDSHLCRGRPLHKEREMGGSAIHHALWERFSTLQIIDLFTKAACPINNK